MSEITAFYLMKTFVVMPDIGRVLLIFLAFSLELAPTHFLPKFQIVVLAHTSKIYEVCEQINIGKHFNERWLTVVYSRNVFHRDRTKHSKNSTLLNIKLTTIKRKYETVIEEIIPKRFRPFKTTDKNQ